MRPENIVTLTGDDLRELALDMADAVKRGARARVTVEDGLKWDIGYGWTLPFGSIPEVRPDALTAGNPVPSP